MGVRALFLTEVVGIEIGENFCYLVVSCFHHMIGDRGMA